MDEHNKNLIKYGKEIIRAESQAIEGMLEHIDEEFAQAVTSIVSLSSSGHVIVSGIGKAGFIAMKLSATLASTGVPSFFLHPAEAVHGDLGRYTKDDLALILSNSGETEEVLKILPTIKRIGCPIISITATKDSTLAKLSDIVLTIGEQSEVGHLGLAPTTSAALMLSLGDAIAMSVLKEKDLSPEEFAMYHPGGKLGRSLMQVGEVMRKEDMLCLVQESASVKETVHEISKTKGRPGAAAIVDSKGILAGIFTDGDLRRCLENDISFLDQAVKNYMGSNPKTIQPEKLCSEALRILSQYKIDQIVVVNQENQPIGMVDIQDLQFIEINK